MSATVRRIRPAPEPNGDLPRVSATRERAPNFDWDIESVFYPELAIRPKHQRRCTHCGYHGVMRRWFSHFVAPWVILFAVIAASVAPGLAVLFEHHANDWVSFYGNATYVGIALLVLAILPVASFLVRYALSYKCPHCNKVGENH